MGSSPDSSTCLELAVRSLHTGAAASLGAAHSISSAACAQECCACDEKFGGFWSEFDEGDRLWRALQEVVICKDNDKLRLLEDNLAQCGDKRVIVFVNTKTHCDVVSRHLDHLAYRCTVLHGGKTQARSTSSCPSKRSLCLSDSQFGCGRLLHKALASPPELTDYFSFSFVIRLNSSLALLRDACPIINTT